MEAPDKIYLLSPHPGALGRVAFEEPILNEGYEGQKNIEYIRKDALVEWANNWLSFERSGIGLDEGFAHAMKIMIDKLDSM